VTLTRHDVENIARLARLQIREDQLEPFAGSLSRIIDFVEQLGSAATDQVEPMAHPLQGMVQRLREDQVEASDQRDLFQQNAPEVAAGLYLVPRVIE